MKLLTSFVHLSSLRQNWYTERQKSDMSSAQHDQPSLLRSRTSLSYCTALSFSSKDMDDEHIISTPRTNGEYTGELLALVIPKEWQDFSMHKDKENRIDSSAFENVLAGIPQNHDTLSTGFQFDTIVDITHTNQDKLIVSMDLDLHIQDAIHLHMNREAAEAASRTFSRLEISAAKKIASVISPRKPGIGKAGKKHKKSASRNLIPTTRVFTRDEYTETTLNTEDCSAKELCETLALKHNSETFRTNSIALALSVPIDAARLKIEPTTAKLIDLEFTITSNPPTILSIQTFESFSSKLFTGVPVIIQTTLIHATEAEVSWFVGNELVSPNSHHFTPQAQQIGKTLSVLITPTREGYHGKCFKEAYQFENVIEDLPFMPIISPLRDDFTLTKRNTKERKSSLRMMTYNILADLYVSRELEDAMMLPHVEYDHVRKTRRIPMIVAEILAHDADIICLQEVDGAIFDTYFEPVMQSMGYEAFYSNKASCQREGCAMFWSRNAFEREEALTFSLRELFDSDGSSAKANTDCWDSMNGIKHLLNSHTQLRRVTMEKIGQILQVVTLKVRNPQDGQPEKIVIGNTHLFYHPMADHIRAMQTYVVCKKVDEIRRCDINQHPYPLMLCGDFNSDPLSGASQLLFTRSVQPDHHDCWKHLNEYQWDMDNNEYMIEHEYIGNEVGATDLKYEDEQFKYAQEHPTALDKPVASAPSIVLPDTFPQLLSGCETMPEFTNFAVDFVDTLDYILASELSKGETYGFSLTKSACMPTLDDVKKFVAMPNEFMPSDHVSLVADFAWRTK